MNLKNPNGEKLVLTARVNHHKNIAHMIEAPVTGGTGIFVALREAINNSFDAGSKDIKIKMGTYNGEPALIISDDGEGFNHARIISAMSYGDSAKLKNDTKTIGVNGTGLKSFLGLGDLKETKLTILSVNKELSDCTKMEINFDYLVKLAEKQADPENHVKRVPVPSYWPKGGTGSILHLTGFDNRRIKTMKQIISGMGERLTPRAIKYIKVYDENSWKKVEPEEMDGIFYDFSEKTKSLGLVEFEIYYGGNGKGVKVCGPINTILDLDDIYKKLSKEQRNMFSKVWKGVSGYIYIENAKKFRAHDNSFSNEFYETKACEEFLAMLNLVGEELEKLAESQRNSSMIKEKEFLLDKIVEIGRELFPPTTASLTNSGNTPPKSSGSKEDIYIVPKGVRLYPYQQLKIKLRNTGTEPVDFSGALWTSKSDAFTINRSAGSTATIKAGKLAGGGEIYVNGLFGRHVVKVIVSESLVGPFIQGPKFIRPGGTFTFELMRHEKDTIVWEIEKGPLTEIKLRVDTENKKKVFLEVRPDCKDMTVVLRVINSEKDKEIARKIIVVSEDYTAQAKDQIFNINNEDYVLKIDSYFPEAVAVVDTLYTDGEMPCIVVNPIHSRIKNLDYTKSIDPILTAIITAALMQQVHEGKVRPQQAMGISEKYISSIREKMPTKKKN